MCKEFVILLLCNSVSQLLHIISFSRCVQNVINFYQTLGVLNKYSYTSDTYMGIYMWWVCTKIQDLNKIQIPTMFKAPR